MALPASAAAAGVPEHSGRVYSAVATDIDGTLLRPDHTASPLTLSVFQKLINDPRVTVILSTGRPHPNVLHKARRQLNLQGCYVVTSNGARVHNTRDEIIYSHDLPATAAKAVAHLALNEPDVATSIYQGEKWLMNKHAKDLTEFYCDVKDVYYYELFNPVEHGNWSDVYKVYFTSHNNRPALDAIVDKIEKSDFADDVATVFSLPYCLEVLAKGIDKVDGVARVLEYVRAQKNAGTGGNTENSEPSASNLLQHDGVKTAAASGLPFLPGTIAFGDGLNDLNMLTHAEAGCMMDNATDALEAALFPKNATAVDDASGGDVSPLYSNVRRIRSNAEDGVALELTEVFQLRD